AILYLKQNPRPQMIANKLGGFYSMVYHKFYIDEIYLFITHKILFHLVAQPVSWFDKHVVDGAVNLTANGTVFFAGLIKKIQSGQMQLYIWFFTSGVLVLTLLMLYLN